MAVTRRKLHEPSTSDQGSCEEVPKIKPIPTKRKISALFFFSLSAFIVLFLLYTTYQRHWRVNTIKSGLVNIEKDIALPQNKRILVGVGGCLDVFVRAADLLDALSVTPPPSIGDPPQYLNSLEDVLNEFLTFFVEGAAAERFVQSEELWLKIRAAALGLGPELKLGGNGPVIAKRMVEEGAEVLLAIQNEKIYRDRISREIKLPGETIDTEQDDYDLHIILEFDKGEKWGPYTASRGNRYIVHRDKHNPQLKGLAAVRSAVKEFNPHLVVLGGLQMLDTYPFTEDELNARLKEIGDFLSELPIETLVHFEMASFVNPKFLKRLTDVILPYSDSIGMNEQELPNLSSLIRTGNIVYISDSKIKVSKTMDDTRELLAILNELPRQKPLTRVHIHTLAYQAVFTLRDNNKWMSGITTAVKSSLTATRYVCGDESIDSTKIKMILDESFSSSAIPGSQRIPIIDSTPVSCWPDGPYEICLAPVLVCTQIKQTGGGGDNLTGVGLLYHLK